MKKGIPRYALAAVLLITGQASLAEAENTNALKPLEKAPSKLYVEGTIGYSNIGDGTPSSYAVPKYDQSVKPNLSNGGFGYSVALGYLLTDKLGLEVGATSYGSQHDEGDSVIHDKKGNPVNVKDAYSIDTKRSQMYDIAGRYSLPISERFDVFGKLGVSYQTRDVTTSRRGAFDTSIEYDESKDRGFGVLYGVGVDYNVTHNIAWTTQAVATTPFAAFGNQDTEETNLPSAVLVSTGLKYTFD